jgi:multiple sugar transport system permease protein
MNKKTTFYTILPKIIRVIVLVFFLLLVILPIYWMFITSIKTTPEIINTQHLTYFPKTVTFEHYKQLFYMLDYGQFVYNSARLSITTALVVTFLSVLGGYGLARYRFKGKGGIMLFILITQMIPSILVIIPMYTVFARIGLIGSHPLYGLVIYYIIANIPFCAITMRSFFERIPYSLEEAAIVDGCTRMQCIRRIILPIMLPGIVAVFVFAFLGAWNELIAGIIFTNQPVDWTIPVGLKSLIGKNNVQWGALMAGGILALLPAAVMFIFIQRYIVEGLTAGAVKE